MNNLKPKTVHLTLGFNDARDYLRNLLEPLVSNISETPIQSGTQLILETTLGKRTINIYFSRKKPGVRIVFNNPIFEDYPAIENNLINHIKIPEPNTNSNSNINSPASNNIKTLSPNKKIKSFKGQLRIGSDETGKGDYFGPLIIWAVFIDNESEAKLNGLLETNTYGIRDSKQFTNTENEHMAGKISELCLFTKKFAYSPSEYNSTHSKQLSNLNKMLGFAHSSAIENLLDLLEESSVIQSSVNLPIIVDQFDRKVMEVNHLARDKFPRFNKTNLIQAPKADSSDIAVAAASILSRANFLQEMKQLSNEVGFNLSRGAGQQVDIDGRRILMDKGEIWLEKNAKLDFKNSTRIFNKKMKGLD